MNTEANSAYFRGLADSLNQRSLSLRVFELHGLYTTLVVEISSILIVRDILRERCLCDEIASLLIQVLIEVGANDNVHRCSLSNLVLIYSQIKANYRRSILRP